MPSGTQFRRPLHASSKPPKQREVVCWLLARRRYGRWRAPLERTAACRQVGAGLSWCSLRNVLRALSTASSPDCTRPAHHTCICSRPSPDRNSYSSLMTPPLSVATCGTSSETAVYCFRDRPLKKAFQQDKGVFWYHDDLWMYTVEA